MIFGSNITESRIKDPDKLADYYGEVIKASLDSISDGGVIVFCPSAKKMDMLFHHWNNLFLFRNKIVHREPLGSCELYQKIFAHMWDSYEDDISEGKKVIFLTYFRGKYKSELARAAYRSAKVVIFLADAEALDSGSPFDDAARFRYKEKLDMCLKDNEQDARIVIIVESYLSDEEEKWLKEKIPDLKTESFLEFCGRLRRFCIRYNL